VYIYKIGESSAVTHTTKRQNFFFLFRLKIKKEKNSKISMEKIVFQKSIFFFKRKTNSKGKFLTTETNLFEIKKIRFSFLFFFVNVFLYAQKSKLKQKNDLRHERGKKEDYIIFPHILNKIKKINCGIFVVLQGGERKRATQIKI
jgi:hypothetical protein